MDTNKTPEWAVVVTNSDGDIANITLHMTYADAMEEANRVNTSDYYSTDIIGIGTPADNDRFVQDDTDSDDPFDGVNPMVLARLNRNL